MSTDVLPKMQSARQPPRRRRRSDRGDASPGRWRRRGLLASGVIATAASAAALFSGATSSPEIGPKLTHTITRGDLIVTVTEGGTLDSSDNMEIKCKVRGHSTVLWVIEGGTEVKPGDELVRLDTKFIEEEISNRTTDSHLASAILARSKADVNKAEIAIDAYLEGNYRSRLEALEKELATAKWNLDASQKMLDQCELLFKRGYAGEFEVEANGFTVTEAELEVKVKETEIDVLNRLTKAMQLETLNGELIATKTRVEGRTAGLKLEETRRDLALEQLAKCVIRAEKAGIVIHPSTVAWKDAPDVTVGATVHKDQVLLLMPDLSKMQVKIGIHESVIDRVKPGLAARITLPSGTLDTEVSSVATFTKPASWWAGNAVKYDTIVQLPSVSGLKPGMSAEVEVVVARHEDVVKIPVAAVVETEQGYFCWVETAEGAKRRSVQLGDSNDEFIVVRAGVKEGDEVVLNPLASIEEARAEIAPKPTHTITRGDLPVCVTEQGTLESSNNTEIRCKVRGDSTIIWVVESGTEVKPGDELIRLDSKQLEDHIGERTKYAFLSRDAAVGSKAHAARAGLAISEYAEGRYRTQLMRLEQALAIAESNLRTAQNMLGHSEMLFDRGYVSKLEVEEKTFAVRRAEMNAEVMTTEINVLKDFTKAMELETLKGDWNAAKAKLDADNQVVVMDDIRIALAWKEFEHCVTKAERAGLVIYPSAAAWKDAPDIAEGATVHKDQVLLLMPDLSKMQVKVGIAESVIDRIRPGMAARVTLPDRTLDGKVSSVAAVTSPAGWWTGNVVKYDVIVQLPSVEGLKPGMSAEVEVIMARHEDVLMIPIAAVVETADGDACWVKSAGGAERRRLGLGDTGDQFVVVEAGLTEGDEVVLNPLASIEEAQTAVLKPPDEAKPLKPDSEEAGTTSGQPANLETDRVD